jgi:uncharacterized protein YegL
MKQDLTEIVAILDKSGSMRGLTDDTIGGYNTFLEEQKAVPGDVNLTTILFNHEYEALHQRVNIHKAKNITNTEYVAKGNTALLDALGKSINELGSALQNTDEKDRPGKVLFLIITDGAENSSREYSLEKIKEMVELQRNTYNWEFIFMGANIDSFSTANSMGIGRSFNYSATGEGINWVHHSLSTATLNYRKHGDVDRGADYKKGIK